MECTRVETGSRRMVRLATLLVAIALVGVGCNADRGGAGNDGGTAADGAAELELVGKGTAFDTAELTASPGAVTITFDNQDDGISHNLHVTGDGVDERTDIESGPTTQTLELDLDEGTYTYVCDVHPQEMEGELTVQ